MSSLKEASAVYHYRFSHTREPPPGANRPSRLLGFPLLLLFSVACGSRSELSTDLFGQDAASAGGSSGGSAAGGSTGDAALPGCAVRVSAGLGYHSCAIRTDGSLWCWGSNRLGQVGDGTAEPARPTPTRVNALDLPVASVEAGGSHTCAVLVDGSLWCWGSSGGGVLGLGTTAGEHCPPSGCEPQPARIDSLGTSVAQVSTGVFHTCAVRTDKTVWCWGSNDDGELGDGTAWPDNPDCYGWCSASPVPVALPGGSAHSVSAGGQHTCARATDGSLWCWGGNYDGELGDGTTSNRSLPVPVGGIAKPVVQASTGSFHTCALLGNGTLWCWGESDLGALGDGSITSDGCSYFGAACKAHPVQVIALGGTVVAVSAGGLHTCAVTSNGLLWCWGQNDDGVVGDGTNTGEDCPTTGSYQVCHPSPVQVRGLRTSVAQVSAGGSHTCAILADQSLWCWGLNNYGQVGDGTIGKLGSTDYLKTAPVQVLLPCP